MALRWSYAAAGVSLVVLGACSDNAPSAAIVAPSPDGPRLVVVSAAVPGPVSTSATAVSYPLYAGGGGSGPGSLVGHVLVWSTLVGGNTYAIHVNYVLDVGCLTETHLQIGLQAADVPQKNGNPIPGQFDSSHSLSCATTDSYTQNVNLGATDNGVVIAAHAVVQGSTGGTPGYAGAYLVSGSSLPVTVTQWRTGTQGAFSASASPAVAAWEPGDDAAGNDPVGGSFWDKVVAADPNGLSLQNAGADWIWRSFRTADPINGEVVRMDATVNLPVATTGTFRITCDNGYAVFLNGTQISGAGDGATAGYGTQLSNTFATLAGLSSNTDLTQHNVSGDGWQSVEAYPVTLQAGANLLSVYGVNEYQQTGDGVPGYPTGPGARAPIAGPNVPTGTIDNNPSGCMFGLQAAAVPGTPGTGSETAWGAPNGFSGATTGTSETGGNFGGKNWATYFTYQVR